MTIIDIILEVERENQATLLAAVVENSTRVRLLEFRTTVLLLEVSEWAGAEDVKNFKKSHRNKERWRPRCFLGPNVLTIPGRY